MHGLIYSLALEGTKHSFHRMSLADAVTGTGDAAPSAWQHYERNPSNHRWGGGRIVVFKHSVWPLPGWPLPMCLLSVPRLTAFCLQRLSSFLPEHRPLGTRFSPTVRSFAMFTMDSLPFLLLTDFHPLSSIAALCRKTPVNPRVQVSRFPM